MTTKKKHLIKKNKIKKPMHNSDSVIRHSTTTLKLGSWSSKEDTILLGCPSNIMAGIILQRPYKACASHRFLLVKDGRKSVKMESMRKQKATELAYRYLAQVKRENEESNLKKQTDIIDTKQDKPVINDNIELETTTLMVEEIGGLVIVLNDQEMVMKTSPKKLIIKGEKLNITIE